MKLTKNIGDKNRVVRMIAGLVLLIISVYKFNDPTWIIGIAIGLLLIFEGAYGWCIWHGIRETNDSW